MDTKTCGKCRHSKPLSSFSKNRNASDGLQRMCKVCANEYAKQNYLENTERYKRKAAQRQHEIREFLREQRRKPCADCEQTFPPYCMDFDHVPARGEKVMELSQMARRLVAWDLIHAELAKCDVVCAVCHRIRTYERSEGSRLD